MNIAVIICLIFIGIFGILAILFTVLKEKGAWLISGFNTLPKEEQVLYDTARMSREQRNQFLIWSGIFILGALGSWLFSPYAALLAFFAWLVLFFRQVHTDTDKAFNKYKKVR